MVKKKTATKKKTPKDPLIKELLPFNKPHPDISLSDAVLKSPDCLAAIIGNVSTMDELLSKAKGGDNTAFFALIRIHTTTHPFDSREGSTLLMPGIEVDRDFYELDWVQKRLKSGLWVKAFTKQFWKAVMSKIKGKLVIQKNRAHLKRYAVLRRDAWNEGLEARTITYDNIIQELKHYGVVEQWGEDASIRKTLTRYGVKSPGGRTKKLRH